MTTTAIAPPTTRERALFERALTGDPARRGTHHGQAVEAIVVLGQQLGLERSLDIGAWQLWCAYRQQWGNPEPHSRALKDLSVAELRECLDSGSATAMMPPDRETLASCILQWTRVTGRPFVILEPDDEYWELRDPGERDRQLDAVALLVQLEQTTLVAGPNSDLPPGGRSVYVAASA